MTNDIFVVIWLIIRRYDMRNSYIADVCGSYWTWNINSCFRDSNYLDKPYEISYVITQHIGFVENSYSSFEDAYAAANNHFAANIQRNIASLEAVIPLEKEDDFRSLLEARLVAWKAVIGTNIIYNKMKLRNEYWRVCNTIIPKNHSVVYALIPGQSAFTKITIKSMTVSDFYTSAIEFGDNVKTPCVVYGIDPVQDGCDKVRCHRDDNGDVFTLFSEDSEIVINRLFKSIEDVNQYIVEKEIQLHNLKTSLAKISN